MYCGGLAPDERLARAATVTEADIDAGWILPGCGHEIDIAPDREDRMTWDVYTSVTNGVEFAISRQHVVRCPFCGYEGDDNRVVEAFEKPVPFEQHEPAMEWARAVRLNSLEVS